MSKLLTSILLTVSLLEVASVTALDARTGPFVQFAPLKNPAQSLVVYDIGAGGEYTGEFARYGIPQLNALEASPAHWLGSYF